MKFWYIMILISIACFGQQAYTYAQYPTADEPELENMLDSMPNKVVINNTSTINTALFDQSDFSIDTDLRQTYNSDDYQYSEERSSDNLMNRLKDWLAKQIQKLFNMADGSEAQQIVEILEIAFYVVIFIAVLFFIIRAIRKKQFKGNFEGKEAIIDDGTVSIAKVIEEDNFAVRIQQFEADTNYRYAIRYYFIWVLKSLKDKQLIKFSDDKTSEDYIREITDTQVRKSYTFASYLYNYIWFGNFEINAAQYGQYVEVFKKLIHLEEYR